MPLYEKNLIIYYEENLIILYGNEFYFYSKYQYEYAVRYLPCQFINIFYIFPVYRIMQY